MLTMTMQTLLTLATLAYLTLTSLASPRLRTQLHPREEESPSKPTLAGIVATITSPNGTDITSAFQTLLYQGPAMSNIFTNQSLTGRDLTERQNSGLPRIMDFCSSRPGRPRGSFVSSQCDYHAGLSHSMQRYKVKCDITGHASRTYHPQYRNEIVSFLSTSLPSVVLGLVPS